MQFASHYSCKKAKDVVWLMIDFSAVEIYDAIGYMVREPVWRNGRRTGLKIPFLALSGGIFAFQNKRDNH